MRRQITQKNIAKIAGVSRQLVSAILGYTKSKRIRCSQKTYKRVMGVVQKYDYRVNRSARALLTKRHGTIGILSYESISIIPENLLLFLGKEAKDRELVIVQENVDADEQFPIMLREDFVDAIIFFGADLRPDIAKQIVKSHIPCLKIDSWKRLPGHSLNYDEAQGINLALTEFNRLGRSHPAFLYAFEDKYSQSRRKAFLELSSKMGFKDAVTAKHGDKDLPSVFSNILKKIPKTDSVILQHPILIGNFDLALKSLGKKTPEDISLACFHYNHYVLLSYPKIFYLNTNPPSLAKKIFELLEKQMNNKYLPPLTTWPYTTRI